MARTTDDTTDADESTDDQPDDLPTSHELKAYQGLELVQRDGMMSNGILIEASVAVCTRRDATMHNFAVPDRDSPNGWKTVTRDHEEVEIAMRTDGEWQEPGYDAEDLPEWVPYAEEVDD